VDEPAGGDVDDPQRTMRDRHDPAAVGLDHVRLVDTSVAGNARTATLTGHGNFLQGKKGTPRPLLLTRHAGCGPLTDLAEQVLALSKMNWNNDALYDALPCTIRYAQILAKTLKHMPGLLPVPYDYRLFM
jgi:hypothetical protein